MMLKTQNFTCFIIFFNSGKFVPRKDKCDKNHMQGTTGTTCKTLGPLDSGCGL
jgi:hypothetical protein